MTSWLVYWDARCRLYRGHEGLVVVTEEQMYSAAEEMRWWALRGFIAAMAYLAWRNVVC